MKKKSDKRNFVWWSLRVSFVLMILLVIFSNLNLGKGITFGIVLAILSLLFLIITFVLSIISLKKHKDKLFAIISLVISSLYILYLLVGFILIKIVFSGIPRGSSW